MWRADSQEQRSFARVHETNSMMKHYLLQLKFSNRGLSDQSHLMFRHFFVRFVIDAFNLAPVFQFSDHPGKIDNRPGCKIAIGVRRL